MLDSTDADRCLSDDMLLALVEHPQDPALAPAHLHIEDCERCFVLLAEVHRALAGAEETPTSALLAQRYEILEEVGRGGMGVVYRARDRRLDRDVAVKILHGGAETRSSDRRQRLLDESKVMAQLRHPNVVTIHDVLFEPDRAYVVMEFVQGQTLRTWLSQTPRRPDEIFAVFESIGEGLAAAHRLGIVHRDFKPDNVLIDDQGRPLITDFGLAELVQPGRGTDLADVPIPSPSRSPRAGGTLAYVPPEQLRADAPVDARSDVFAFCVALWEALSTVRPFPEQSVRGRLQAVQQGRVSDPPPGTIPRRVQTVLRQGLSPRPEDRPDSLSLLLRQLRRARHRRSIPAAIGLGTLSVVSALAWWGRSTEPDAVGPCAASSIVGDDLVPDLDRLESSLQDRLEGMGMLVASDARAKASELQAAIELTTERTCHSEAAGHLSPLQARARAYCLRTLGVQLRTVVTRAMQTPDALAFLLEIRPPAMCEAWSSELQTQSLAGRIRSAEDQALADALDRLLIGHRQGDELQELEATMLELLDRASEAQDRWLEAQALLLASKISNDDGWSRDSALRAVELFTQVGDPVGRIAALTSAAIAASHIDKLGPPIHYQRARSLYERLEDPAAIPELGIGLDYVDMLIAFDQGDYPRARRAAERAQHVSARASPEIVLLALTMRPMFNELDGDYDASVRSWEALIDWLEGRGAFAQRFLADAELGLSALLLDLGRPEQAEQAWTRANALMKSIRPDGTLTPESLLLRVSIDAMTDRLPSGLARLEPMIEQSTPRQSHGSETRTLQAEILLRMGHLDEALAIVEPLRHRFPNLEQPSPSAQEPVGRYAGLDIAAVIAEIHRRRGELGQAHAALAFQSRWHMEHYPHAIQSMQAALVQAWIDADRGALDAARARFESLEQAIPSPYESAWASVGRVVAATRAGDPPAPHGATMERARQTLGAFPLSYRYEMAVIDAWHEQHADALP